MTAAPDDQPARDNEDNKTQTVEPKPPPPPVRSLVQTLILDDLGLRPLGPEESGDLYELVRRRYEQGSLVLTSNRAVSEWGALFGDALWASAALDRLLHHAHVVVLDGPSYRTQRTAEARPKRRGAEATAPASQG